MNNSTDSSSPVDINDDATINSNHNSDEIPNLTADENNENEDSIPKTIREAKLLDVSRLFHLCYRTVIPNRPPSIASSTTLLPQGLSSFNPRPIGMNLFFLLINKILLKFRTRNCSIN